MRECVNEELKIWKGYGLLVMGYGRLPPDRASGEIYKIYRFRKARSASKLNIVGSG